MRQDPFVSSCNESPFDGRGVGMHHPSLMRFLAIFAAVAGVLLGPSVAPELAHADTNDYFGEDAPDEHISYQIDKSRTKKQKIILASLAAGSVVFAGVGLLFHLDSQRASNDVAAIGAHTGKVYSPEVDETRDRAFSSRTYAIVGYGIGGAFAIATVVALIVTQPGSQRYTVGSQEETPPPPVVSHLSVAPMAGGAYVGGTWSF